MSIPLQLDPDRFFPVDPRARKLARALYETVENFPIISPHGHTDPAWFAHNETFGDATECLLTPDHYLLRMLYSQGIPMEALRGDKTTTVDAREAWRLFASNYFLFRGTPSRIWLDHIFADVFGLKVRLSASTADHYFDEITAQLQTDAFRPRAILDRFNVELIATTEGALASLDDHAKLIKDGWGRRVITTFRPDDVMDPDQSDFAKNLAELANLTSEDTGQWSGYLDALRKRRKFFRAHGAVATDHAPPSPRTADLAANECQSLLTKCITRAATAEERELFRAQMLTEMAGMSREDGMVMQVHPGSHRNHNAALMARFGADIGADIPVPVSYTVALAPLLNKHGNDAEFSLILFTLDETTYARELAPLAGHYPCLKIGPPWWFHDSLEGMLRYRHQLIETAGFYNTAGFNDDTRALLSIPARHDLVRRVDCRFLAQLVCESRIEETEAFELAQDIFGDLVRRAYKLRAFHHEN